VLNDNIICVKVTYNYHHIITNFSFMAMKKSPSQRPFAQRAPRMIAVREAWCAGLISPKHLGADLVAIAGVKNAHPDLTAALTAVAPPVSMPPTLAVGAVEPEASLAST